MPGTSEEFNRYEIHYYTDRPFAPFQAMIYCYREQQYVGRIVFYPEDSVPMSGQASLHYAFSRFAEVITMLRHEKPLYLYWDSYTDGEDEVWWGMIATSQEPASAPEA